MTTLYKFLRTGLKSQHGDFQWKIGQWEKINQPLEICNVGFHSCERILDALGYVHGEIVALTEVRGESVKGDNKQAWSEMRIIKAWHWTKRDSVLLAICAAESVIDIYESKFPSDDRPRKAIETAKTYLENPSSDTADSAYTAAADAAHAAAAATRAAAAAARAAAAAAHAAGHAAVFVTRAAADAAADAACAAADIACAAALNKIESWLKQHIETLEPWDEQK